jgi:predicted DNA-binding transcriptional regulator YafY
MLTTQESEALMAAIRLLQTWGGASLSQALESAQEKVLAILPAESRRKAEQSRCSRRTLARRAIVKISLI